MVTRLTNDSPKGLRSESSGALSLSGGTILESRLAEILGACRIIQASPEPVGGDSGQGLGIAPCQRESPRAASLAPAIAYSLGKDSSDFTGCEPIRAGLRAPARAGSPAGAKAGLRAGLRAPGLRAAILAGLRAGRAGLWPGLRAPSRAPPRAADRAPSRARIGLRPASLNSRLRRQITANGVFAPGNVFAFSGVVTANRGIPAFQRNYGKSRNFRFLA